MDMQLSLRENIFSGQDCNMVNTEQQSTRRAGHLQSIRVFGPMSSRASAKGADGNKGMCRRLSMAECSCCQEGEEITQSRLSRTLDTSVETLLSVISLDGGVSWHAETSAMVQGDLEGFCLPGNTARVFLSTRAVGSVLEDHPNTEYLSEREELVPAVNADGEGIRGRRERGQTGVEPVWE
ncbi:hypothetical protein P7K49_030065 [Saguinus oedipus]|uniref:Uncharacterized protein n=1 Tax=Saguinus oedipus TaxID=9490 RepID=A0ABQ9U147_SAGOE|nr:hypothetical protein P7K49_030065 [Saguinus oedipus]